MTVYEMLTMLIDNEMYKYETMIVDLSMYKSLDFITTEEFMTLVKKLKKPEPPVTDTVVTEPTTTGNL